MSGVGSPISVTGHVTSVGSPLAGASIFACPQSGGGAHGACQSATSDASGAYAFFGLDPGHWLLQLSPPSRSGLFGAQAVVEIVSGRPSQQDFDLSSPVALSDGFSVNGQTSGVPTVNWNTPFDVHIPLHLPHTGNPNSVTLFVEIAGIAGAGSTGADTGFNLAMLSMFGVHYGANGLPDDVGPSFTSQLDCSGSPSPCAQWLSGQQPTNAVSSDSRRATGADPVAHAAGCPPTPLDMTIKANEVDALPTQHGVEWVSNFDGNTTVLGTTNTYQPPNFAPPPVDPDFPLASQVLALPGKAVNSMINAPFAVYNHWVTQTQALSIAARTSDPQVAQQETDNAVMDMGVEALQQAYHGDSQIVEHGLHFADEKSLDFNMENNTATFDGQIDCPPGTASLPIDPSGNVRTSSHIPVAGAKVVLTRSDTAKGKQTQVPNGSHLMDVSNRRNPDTTTALGVFHWLVFPGFYQVKATHSGCRAAHGNSLFGFTPVLPVPPPQTNLLITLRCPHLHRAATRVTLSRASRGKLGGVIRAAVRYRGRGGSIPMTRLPGTVTFKVNGGRALPPVPLDVRHGWAFFDLPVTGKPVKLLTATFSGNGYLAPSVARLKHP